MIWASELAVGDVITGVVGILIAIVGWFLARELTKLTALLHGRDGNGGLVSRISAAESRLDAHDAVRAALTDAKMAQRQAELTTRTVESVLARITRGIDEGAKK